MKAHTLFTYRNLGELRRIQEKQEVFPFAFGDTKKQIKASPKITIDISALVYFLQIEKSNILSVYINFIGMTNETVIIAEESVSQSAMEILPFLLSNTSSFFLMKEDVPSRRSPLLLPPSSVAKSTSTTIPRNWIRLSIILQQMAFQLRRSQARMVG